MAEREITDVIGANVRRLREARGWTQAQLAHRVSVQGLRKWAPGIVGLIETGGQRGDRLLDVVALARVFRVDLTELVEPTDQITELPGPAGREPIDLSRVQSWLRGMYPDEEGEESTYYTEEEDPYDLMRIARKFDLTKAELGMVTWVLWRSYDFLAIRDEQAGVNVNPGNHRSIQARRGRASTKMFAEIRELLDLKGKDGVMEQYVQLQRAAVQV